VRVTFPARDTPGLSYHFMAAITLDLP